MREKKFNFVNAEIELNALKNRQKEERKKEGFVSISSTGILTLNKDFVLRINGSLEKSFYLSFYVDVDKKALAFKKVDSLNSFEIPKNYRYIQPIKISSGKYSSITFRTSIRQILSLFGNVKLPINRIQVEEYIDNDFLSNVGKVYVILLKDKISSTEDNKQFGYKKPANKELTEKALSALDEMVQSTSFAKISRLGNFGGYSTLSLIMKKRRMSEVSANKILEAYNKFKDNA